MSPTLVTLTLIVTEIKLFIRTNLVVFPSSGYTNKSKRVRENPFAAETYPVCINCFTRAWPTSAAFPVFSFFIFVARSFSFFFFSHCCCSFLCRPRMLKWSNCRLLWLRFTWVWSLVALFQRWFECQISWATAFAFQLASSLCLSFSPSPCLPLNIWLNDQLVLQLGKRKSCLRFELVYFFLFFFLHSFFFAFCALVCIFSHIDRMSSCWGSGEDEYNNISPNINNNIASRGSGSGTDETSFHWENGELLGACWGNTDTKSKRRTTRRGRRRRRRWNRQRIHELITSFVVGAIEAIEQAGGCCINPACADVCEFPDHPTGLSVCVWMNLLPVGCASVCACVCEGAPSCRAMHILWMKWSTAELRNCCSATTTTTTDLWNFSCCCCCCCWWGPRLVHWSNRSPSVET